MMDDFTTNPSSAQDQEQFICGVIEGFYGKPWRFDQRKELFVRLKNLGLNSFVYAPKDDTKHRANWREPYSDQELKALKELIDEAKLCGIHFYYSLAPGIDMIYSNKRDFMALIDKYDQLVNVGCDAFAILFDDIEPIIKEEDGQIFQHYAAAQVSVTNAIFEHLKKPKFLFCPTEYCESRAVPNIKDSVYLNTIGNGLCPEISIMWSGSRVISRYITEESIDELASVIKRPPLIWENLHANDYDNKRIFLGPYSGRSTKIIPKLRGVLTNPNCEYEANFIAIHTLAQWSKCTRDINRLNKCNPDNRVSPEELYDDIASQSDSLVYCPDRALKLAITDWLPRFFESKCNLIDQQTDRRDDEAAQEQLVKDNETQSKNVVSLDTDVTVAMDTPEDSKISCTVENTEDSTRSDIDMRESPLGLTPAGSNLNLMDTSTCDSCDMQVAGFSRDSDTTLKMNEESDINDCMVSPQLLNTLTSSSLTQGQLEADHLSLLVDLFYLPFEHGSLGCLLLQETKWLKYNSNVMLTENMYRVEEDKDNFIQKHNIRLDSHMEEVNRWTQKSEDLSKQCNLIIKLVDTILDGCPNKVLVGELYPYLVNLRDSIIMVMDYVKYLKYRNSTDHDYPTLQGSKNVREVVSLDDQEPWSRRGGLVGDLQRLLF